MGAKKNKSPQGCGLGASEKKRTGEERFLMGDCNTARDHASASMIRMATQASGRAKKTNERESVRSVLEKTQTSPHLALERDRVLAVLADHGKDEVDPTDPRKRTFYQVAKLRMPVLLPQVDCPAGTPRARMPFQYHNGLYLFDVDEDMQQGDLEVVLEDLVSWPHMIITAKSVSQEALWCVARGPGALDQRHFRHYRDQVMERLPQSVRDHTPKKGQKELSRMRYWSGDPDAIPGAGATLALDPPSGRVYEAPGWEKRTARGETKGPPELEEDAPGKTPAQKRTRTRTRNKVSEDLQAIPLPDGDSHDEWVRCGFALITADIEFFSEGLAFRGRDLFTRWTNRNAHAASTKPDRANDQYSRLRGEFSVEKACGDWRGYIRQRAAEARSAAESTPDGSGKTRQERTTHERTTEGEQPRDWQWAMDPESAAIRLLHFASHYILGVRDLEAAQKTGWRVLTTRTGVWEKDESQLRALLRDSAARWGEDAVKASRDGLISTKKEDRIHRYRREMRRRAVREDVISQIPTMLNIFLRCPAERPDGLLLAVPSDLDPAGYLGAPNGVVALKDGHMLGFDTGREKLVTRSIPDPYDPTTPLTPEVQRMLKLLEDDVREAWWNGWGFGLWRDPGRRFYVAVSEGTGTGKSTSLQAFAKAIGDQKGQYGGVFSPDAFAFTRTIIKNSHTSGTLDLYGPAHAIGGELTGHQIDTGDMNRVASGNDAAQPREVGQPSRYTGAATATMWWSANINRFRGTFEITDQALAARICLLKWERETDGG